MRRDGGPAPRGPGHEPGRRGSWRRRTPRPRARRIGPRPAARDGLSAGQEWWAGWAARRGDLRRCSRLRRAAVRAVACGALRRRARGASPGAAAPAAPRRMRPGPRRPDPDIRAPWKAMTTLVPLWGGAVSVKDSPSHTYNGGTLFHRHLEVVGHSHRQADGLRDFGRHPVTDLDELHEVGTGLLGIGHDWEDRHDSEQRDAECREGDRRLHGVIGIDPRLLRLPA